MYQRMRSQDDQRVAAEKIAQYGANIPYIKAFPNQQQVVQSVVQQFNLAAANDPLFDRRTATEKENLVRSVLANIETTLAMTAQAYGGKLPEAPAAPAAPVVPQPQVMNDQTFNTAGIIPPRFAFGPDGVVYERTGPGPAQPAQTNGVIPNGAPPPAPTAATQIPNNNGFPKVATEQNLQSWFQSRMAQGR